MLLFVATAAFPHGAGEEGGDAGQMVVDMTLDATTTTPTYGGTVTIGYVVWRCWP